MALAVAARRLASSSGLLKVPSVLRQIRCEGNVPFVALSKEEMEKFLKDTYTFLERAHSSLSQEDFGNLIKNLSCSMSSLAMNKGILYPTELANLAASFVPVAGTYVPHNSKVVVVDLVQRMDRLGRDRVWRNGVVIAAVATFAGMGLYWPAAAVKLEHEDKLQEALIATAQSKIALLDGKVGVVHEELILACEKLTILKTLLDDKVGTQEKTILAFEKKLTTMETVLEDKVGIQEKTILAFEKKLTTMETVLEDKVGTQEKTILAFEKKLTTMETVLEDKVGKQDKAILACEKLAAMETQDNTWSSACYAFAAGMGLSIMCVYLGEEVGSLILGKTVIS